MKPGSTATPCSTTEIPICEISAAPSSRHAARVTDARPRTSSTLS